MRVAWFSTDRPLSATLNGERLVVKGETLSQEVGRRTWARVAV